MFQNVIPWKFWNNIPLRGKYTVKFWNNIPLGGIYTVNSGIIFHWGENTRITMKIALGENNSRPLVYKTSALTPELRRHVR